MDADASRCVSYLVGGRGAGWALDFTEDCAARVPSRVQITADGHKVYLDAVGNLFGAEVDYAQLRNIYGAVGNETRYSAAADASGLT